MTLEVRLQHERYSACDNREVLCFAGPLTVLEGGRHTLVGISSWGNGCGVGYPGVYARVTTVLHWIKSILFYDDGRK